MSILSFDRYSITLVGDNHFYLSTTIRDELDTSIKAFLPAYFVDLDHLLNFLSVFSNTSIRIMEKKMENGQFIVNFETKTSIEDLGKRGFETAFKRLISMQRGVLRKYLDSCSAFGSALLIENTNYSIAFLLLVVSIESLSSNKYTEGSFFEKFLKFMTDFLNEDRRFLPAELKYVEKTLTAEEKTALFQKLLKSIYGRIRSGFAHFGEETSVTSIVADRFQLAYVKTYDDGEKLSPGFEWFRRISNEALLNFLFAQELGENQDLFSLLSEKFVHRVKAKKGIDKGELITPENIHMQ